MIATYARLPGHETREAADDWAASHGLVVVALHLGPDGLYRGLATDPDTAARDLLVRARGLAEVAEGMRP